MSVAFKRHWEDFDGLDGTFHINNTNVYHNNGGEILKIDENGITSPSVRLHPYWRIGSVNVTGTVLSLLDEEENPWSNSGNPEHAHITRHRFSNNGTAEHNVVKLIGNNADTNTFNGKSLRVYLHLYDQDDAATNDWWLARSENNDEYLSLVTRHTPTTFIESHAFGKDTFRTRNVVILPEEDEYNVEGGGGPKSRKNYIRFNYGRQWAISSESNGDQISENALYIRCGSGGDDPAVMRFEPDGVFMKIPTRSWTGTNPMLQDPNLPPLCIVFNPTLGHLYFKYYGNDNNGIARRFLKKISLVDAGDMDPDGTGKNDDIGRVDEDDDGADEPTNVDATAHV